MLVAKRYKERVEEAYKELEVAAADELATLKSETGTAQIESMFTEGAGIYHYSKIKAKKVEQYALADEADLSDWIAENAPAMARWLASKSGKGQTYAALFGAWWFNITGELPDGMTRTVYEEPEKQGPPKVYQYDPAVIDDYFEKNGGWLMCGSGLLLGDGE